MKIYLNVSTLVLTFYFSLLYLYLSSCNGLQITELFKKFKITRGRRLSGDVISTYHVRSSIECAKACCQDMLCISYNLIKESNAMICELNSNGLVDVFVPDVKSSYYGLFIYFVIIQLCCFHHCFVVLFVLYILLRNV